MECKECKIKCETKFVKMNYITVQDMFNKKIELLSSKNTPKYLKNTIRKQCVNEIKGICAMHIRSELGIMYSIYETPYRICTSGVVNINDE